MLSIQLLLIQLSLIFFEFSFGKLWELLNQKKVCFFLRIKKDICTRVPYYIQTQIKVFYIFVDYLIIFYIFDHLINQTLTK